MNVVDTNVWVYTHDVRDPRKQQLARDAVAAAQPMVLPWQVGCEFVAASRKLLPFGYTTEKMWQNLQEMQDMAITVAMPDVSDWPAARELQSRDMLSFWDALLLATCMRHGVKTLYTEDFGSPRTLRGISIVNPFASA